MGVSNPPYIPRFGAGAPAFAAPNGTVYYDTAAGYAEYIRNGGAWRAVGVVSLTVITLPSAVTAGIGARSFVSDALAPAFGVPVASGGAVATPVYSDGAQWVVG